MFVCLLACLYQINDKRAEPIGRKFIVRPHMTPVKIFDFRKIFKIHEKIEQQLKVEMEDLIF